MNDMVYSDYTSYTFTNVGFTAEQNKLDHILIYSPQEGSVNICKEIPQNGLHAGASSWFNRVICMWLKSDWYLLYAVKMLIHCTEPVTLVLV